jgi:cell division protein FtsI/penicillin-binding protein 2
MSKRSWIGVGVAVGVAALIVVGLATVVTREPALPRTEVAAYLRAWERFDGNAMARLVDRPQDLPTAVTDMKDQLSVTRAKFISGRMTRHGNTVRAQFTAELDLAGLGTWRYTGQFDVQRADGRWRVVWTPAALHPALAPGQKLGVTRTWPQRAPILDDTGAALVASGDVIVVGLEPSRITDEAEVEDGLQRLVDVSPGQVRTALGQPWVRPNDFVPITDVRPDRFTALRPQLEPIPGVFFQRGTGRVGPAADFAPQVVGTYGEVTADRLRELGAPYLEGDEVGLTGVEAAFERRLAGTPSGEVQLQANDGSVVAVLYRFTGSPPRPVQLTLDPPVQQAAERALAGVTKPAAVVALDTASGDIRAVVSHPLDNEFNRALVGQYPPGSTFKVVTSAALLAGGLRPGDTVQCPPEATVGGRTFTNFESEALGAIPFTSAFANSCNTAFVNLSTRLTAASLAQTATQFGFGSSYDLGLPVAGGQFPVPADSVELAAAAIGQGRVLASPVEMASVAAAVASGAWRPPRLLGDAPAGAAKPLDASVAATLRQLMVSVVRDGTGTAAAEPGQVVAGKTGTAEFGSGDPPLTHAWFIGFRGTLAFAVLVEGGGVGGEVAAPVARRLLDALPA